jgi:SAM-dependent methyltransferase
MRTDFYEEYFRTEDQHWWFVGRRRIVLEALSLQLSRLGEPSNLRILDFGCGTGAMLTHLRRFGTVEGVDADERAIGFCRSRGETQVHLLESGSLPFEDESFDLVTAFDVLEHIDDDRGALAETRRVLRPGGTLMITVPAYQWMWGPHDEINDHKRRYSSAELETKIASSGLELARLTHFNTLLLPVIAAVRLVRKRLPDRSSQSDFGLGASGPANDILAAMLSSEARYLRRHDLPVGVSILAMATAR